MMERAVRSDLPVAVLVVSLVLVVLLGWWVALGWLALSVTGF